MKNLKNGQKKNGDFFEDNFPQGKQTELGLLVADQISAMIAYWDRDEICRYANSAYLKWYGKSNSGIIDNITMQELLGILYDKNHHYLKEVLKGKTQIFEQETISPLGDINHSITTYTADKISGIVKGFFVHITDITVIKLKEKEIIQSNEMVSDQNNRLTNYTYLVSYNLKSSSVKLEKTINSFIEAKNEKEKGKILGSLYDLSSRFSETIKDLNDYISSQSRVNLELSRKLLLNKVPVKSLSKMPHQLSDFKKNRPNGGGA
ncbi:MAG: PAS domain-containing protein [Bacteroidota bacterium]|nr:PAS domain-containing protein [Bacteroidota bacterium]